MLAIYLFILYPLLFVDALVVPGHDNSASLKPVRNNRTRLHPSIVYQQHTNRALRRLARMATGKPGPTDAQLSSLIVNTLKAFAISRDDIKRDGYHSSHLNIEANDVGYTTNVDIGTPQHQFQMVVDTGSADFWIGSEDCLSDQGSSCGKHSFIGPKVSSTFIELNQTWSIEYNTGELSGTLAEDTVSVAGFDVNSFEFGVAKKESNDFTSDDATFDGILGTAKAAVSKQGILPFVDFIRRHGDIKDSIVSYKLPRLDDGTDDGEVTFGTMNPDRFDVGSLVQIKNNNHLGFWGIPIDGVNVNGTPLTFQKQNAVLDTGTTLIMGPEKDVAQVHSYIPGSKLVGGMWTVPCSGSTRMSMRFGGNDFEIDSRDMVFSSDSVGDSSTCLSGITSSADGRDWLIGDVFLKNVYFSTNIDKDEVSLAKLKH